jgi:hypothetical protein
MSNEVTKFMRVNSGRKRLRVVLSASFEVGKILRNTGRQDEPQFSNLQA